MVSIWEKETFFAPQDVIIIGSGFVGLWSAFYLKKKNPHLKITLVESGLIPSGASTRNAGFACFGSLSEIIYDAKTMGTDKMLQLVEMRFKGLERITKHFSENDIDFSLCGGYELYDNSDEVTGEQLLHNIEYVNSILKPITKSKKTYKLADNKIAPFGFGNTSHLVKNNLEGYLHSGRLLQCLLNKIQGMGVTVLNNLKICSFESDGEMMNLSTNQQVKFQTKKILLCTNAFTKHLVEDIDIKPARGQVLLTSPIDNLPFKGTFHSDEGFYYFRNLGNKVLLGGARNKAFDEETSIDPILTPTIQIELERYLKEVILPWTNDYSIEYRWSGIMAMGTEKMPIVKELQPNVYCAVRMSGMGVALAPVVSQQIAEMMYD